jgi:hypothetical protein
MSDGNLPAGNAGHPKPTCRLVSLSADSRQASAQTNDRQVEVRKVVVGVIMVTLLGLACMGVVFTLKHRQLRSERQANTKLVQGDVKPVVMPVSFAPAPKPKLVPQSPFVMQKLPVSPVAGHSVSPIPNPPNDNETEVLAVLPRAVQVMGETTRESGKAGMSVPDVPSDIPAIRPSNLLPETPPPADSR